MPPRDALRALRAAGRPARSRLLGLGYEHLARPALFGSYHGDPERTHEATLRLLARVGRSPAALRTLSGLTAPPRTPVTVAGVTFPGIVGLAAGMDKDGVALKAWSSLGFGHVELGTVTAQPQPGNVQPRLFRLPHSRAIINRMGFNNHGAAALATRLSRAGVWRGNGAAGMPVGISIGKTKATPLAEATEDYLVSFRLLSLHADYVAVNVSSPNTPGLRTLQDRAALSELLVSLVEESQALAGNLAPVPVFVKIAPDLGEQALDEVLDVCLDAGVAGLVATNTTLGRDGVHAADWSRAAEPGGLSGSPLTLRSRQVVHYLTTASPLPVIGVGGIMTVDGAAAMLDAGASLLQVYTGFIYTGPGLVGQINQLRRDS